MKKNAFTLIELIVVIIIIGILASVAVPAYQSYVKSSKEKSAKSLQKEITVIIDAHYNMHGSIPTDSGSGDFTAPASLSSSSDIYDILETFMKGPPINPFCPNSSQGNAGLTWSESTGDSYSLATLGITYTITDASIGAFTVTVDESSGATCTE